MYEEEILREILRTLQAIEDTLELALEQLKLMNSRAEDREDYQDSWENYQRIRQRWQEHLDQQG